MSVARSLLLMLLVFAAEAHASSSVIVRSQLQPAEDVVPGQSVRLMIDVLFPDLMPRPPLVEVPQPSGAQILRFETQAHTIRELIDGQDYVGQRFEFALFARRGGLIEIPSAEVTLLDRNGDATSSLKGQTLRLSVATPPGLDLSGPVLAATVVTVNEAWTPEPTRPLRAGDAITRTITRHAAGVPALGMADFVFAAPEGVRVYADPPQSDDRINRGAIEGSRVDKATYVFEKAGAYDLPALAQPWWNLGAKQARTERLAGVHLVVAEAARPAAPSSRLWAGRTARFCVALAALAVCVFAARRLRAALVGRRLRYASSAAAARCALVEVAKSGDASKTLNATLLWLGRLPREEARATRGDPQFKAACDRLERTLFGAAEPWSKILGAELARSVLALPKFAAAGLSSESLPPLNSSG